MAKRNKKQRLGGEADSLWRSVVRRRGDFKCARCGTTYGLECHHLLGRGAAHRHDPDNGMLLCWACHGWRDNYPKKFANWLVHRYPEIAGWMDDCKNDQGKATIEAYEEAIRTLSKEIETSWMN